MRKDIIDKKQEIINWINQEKPISWIANELHCKIDTLKRYFKLLNIKYAGQQNKKGQKKGGHSYKIANEYLVVGTPKISTMRLKNKLLHECLKEAKCECCGNTMWLNEPIPLELHHIDGNKSNNSIENLQLLCPNCHAKTENYRGKNMKVVRDKKTFEDLAKQENATGLNPVASACEFNSHSPHQYSNHSGWSKSIEEHTELANLGKIDSLGRTNNYYLSNDEWEVRKQLIINSGINLLEYGWKSKVEKATGLTRRQVCLTIEKFKDFFNTKIYKRN